MGRGFFLFEKFCLTCRGIFLLKCNRQGKGCFKEKEESKIEPTLKTLRRKKWFWVDRLIQLGYPYGVCRIVLGWSFSTDRIPLRGMQDDVVDVGFSAVRIPLWGMHK
jgi:hypothetical protein